MSIYHLSVKTVSRSSGRSATGASAYRSASKIEDQKTGLVHDYTRKQGVECSEIVLPKNAPEAFRDRVVLWNAAEASETRKNSTVAREFEVAIPAELSPIQQLELVREFAKAIVTRHQCAVDFAIHAPGKEGDQRNYHAHVLCTTRRIGEKGFGEKTRELDERTSGEVADWRQRWEDLENRALERAGVKARVSCRSLEEQGIEREAGIHHGPAISGILRRGEASAVLQRVDLEATKRLEEIKKGRDDAATLDKEIARVEQEKKDLYKEYVQASLSKPSSLITQAKEAIEADKARHIAELLSKPSSLITQAKEAIEAERSKSRARTHERERARERSHGHER